MVSKRINGRPRKIKLGRYPDLTVHQARRHAQETLVQIANGTDPNQAKRAESVAAITLQKILDEYCDAKNVKLKPTTISDYRRAMSETWGDFLHRPLNSITRSIVKTRNEKRGKISPTRTANAMRVLRAICNYARGAYHDEGLYKDNPVDVLRDTGTWHRVKRKKTFIDRPDLPAWWAGVSALDSIPRDYFIFLLLTGVRAGEADTLRWGDVNIQTGVFTIRDPKNREDVTLPLSDYLWRLLKKREQSMDLVFPNIGDARRLREQITKSSGIPFTRHDLRRSFLTIGESLDIGFLTLKRLANHKAQDADVTSGYIQTTEDRKREATNRITSFILEVVK